MPTSTTRQTVLITGASSGLGLEFARLFARSGYHLVLTARSQANLEALSAELTGQYGINAHVIVQDLADVAAPAAILAQIEATDITIDILVNNAGFASYGTFAELDVQNELNMIQVNITALTHLTRLFVPSMIARKQGRILNVASTAAFMPGPLMTVYYASKAYVLSFSEALSNELQGTGVTVSVLCPGITATGFQKRAVMGDSKLLHGRPIADAASVVQAGYTGLMAGQTVIVPGMRNKFETFLVRLLPRKLVVNMVRRTQEQTGANHA